MANKATKTIKKPVTQAKGKRPDPVPPKPQAAAPETPKPQVAAPETPKPQAEVPEKPAEPETPKPQAAAPVPPKKPPVVRVTKPKFDNIVVDPTGMKPIDFINAVLTEMEVRGIETKERIAYRKAVMKPGVSLVTETKKFVTVVNAR